MQNIEQYLDQFMGQMKHTPGPWEGGHTPFYLRMKQTGDPITLRSDAHTEEIATVWTCMLPTEANAKLIAQSPNMLRSICRTYLQLLLTFRYGQDEKTNLLRIGLDSTLALLRNDITLATGLDGQYVQDTFEQYVKDAN